RQRQSPGWLRQRPARRQRGDRGASGSQAVGRAKGHRVWSCHGISPPVTERSKERCLDFPLAVNGTLMRGLELNPRLLAVGARFDRETTTVPGYRLWSIDDRHPAMLRVREGGAAIAVEVWRVPETSFAPLLMSEPPGLCIGKVQLADGEETLGVLGEPSLCEG